MLVSRSPQEAHLYMELHPCECGQPEFEWDEHRLVDRDDLLLSVYVGECYDCERERVFEFVLAEGSYPASPGFGGPQPSAIIDPGEFLAASLQAAQTVPADPSALDGEDFEDAYDTLEYAVEAVDEVLKFVPADADAVPAEAFRSATGQELYQEDADQFSRARLESVRNAYRQVLDQYEAHAPPDS